MRRDDEADDDAYAIDDGETKRREVLKAVVVVAEIGAVLHAWQFVLASANRERTAAEVDIFMVMVVVGSLWRRPPAAASSPSVIVIVLLVHFVAARGDDESSSWWLREIK